MYFAIMKARPHPKCGSDFFKIFNEFIRLHAYQYRRTLQAHIALITTDKPAMPSPLHFRTATPTDLPAIITLLADDELGRQREVVADPVDNRYLAAFNAIAADANQRLVVAEQDGRVVGTMQLSFVPGLSHTGAWRGQIEAVRIAADLRGQGAGQQMFAWALEEFRAKGCAMVELTTNAARKDAQRFYQKLGFTASHVGFKIQL